MDQEHPQHLETYWKMQLLGLNQGLRGWGPAEPGVLVHATCKKLVIQVLGLQICSHGLVLQLRIKPN